jgi:RecB family exonuclease/inactivated superfamily I helicase
LAAAAQLLLEERVTDGVADLSEVVVALPGGRAGRRLLEILIDRADQKSWILIPPQIITTGRLPELLYVAQRPFANDLTQRLAWIEALKQTDRERLLQVIREPPGDGDLFAWLSLGEMLSRLHRELAADGFDFSDVVRRAAELEGFNESERWQSLAEIQQAYLRRLDALELWDLQTARLFAVAQQECATDKQIVLVGTVDLNRTQRAMLDQVADHVTAVIFAPDDLADRFDEHGCLRSDAWLDVPIDLDREIIDVVDTSGDQADAVMLAMSKLDGVFSAEEITVGVPDERLVAPIQQRLDECGVPSRYGVGIPATRMGPSLLLKATADYLESRRPDAFAALVRHPAVSRWLASRKVTGDWLTQLDRYRSAHLPTRLDGKWQRPTSDAYQSLRDVFDELHRKPSVEDKPVGLLHELSGAKRPLGDWADAVIQLVINIYGRISLAQDHADEWNVIAACDAIRDALAAQRDIPAELAPSVSSAEAIRLLLQSLSGQTVPPRADHTAVELLGWLELPLDDAPALIVSGFNDGLVPASRNSDLFLPNELRRQLGLEDNNRIYARDTYALSVITASRKSLKLIAGRRTADNDPLIPSRLLFACEPRELAQRTLEFLRGTSKSKPRIEFAGSLAAGREQSVFAPPLPLEPLDEVTSMRVTEFKDYLACPYRYYLRHRLNLKGIDDGGNELGGGEFGSLLHEVLKAFGQSDTAASDVADEVKQTLNHLLDDEVSRQFGAHPLSAVNVQVEQIRRRLEVFAVWQAEWVAEGWMIEVTECDIKDGTAPFAVDDLPMYLRGRIDRIDRHRATGEIVIFDYKTGESANKPEKTHRRRDDWVDLQLPLYRHLVRFVEEQFADVDPATVRLGYIVIPKSLDAIGHHLAEWTADDLAEADETAREVIRNIRAGIFGPPNGPPPAFFEEFAAICLDGQFGANSQLDDAEVE